MRGLRPNYVNFYGYTRISVHCVVICDHCDQVVDLVRD